MDFSFTSEGKLGHELHPIFVFTPEDKLGQNDAASPPVQTCSRLAIDLLLV